MSWCSLAISRRVATRSRHRVKVRQRFVEQEDARIAHDGAADGDALALAAGKLFGQPVQQMLDLQHARGLAHAAVDLGLVGLPASAEGHVVIDIHMRIKRIALEHHGDPRSEGTRSFTRSPSNSMSPVEILKPRDQAQERGLAAARGADKDHELALADVQVDALMTLTAP